MKKCPGCGGGFVGFEKLCPVCLRRPESSTKVVDALVSSDGDMIVLKEVAGRTVPSKLVSGKPCPTCGVKYRPRMSDAERQRQYRKRKGSK